MSRLAFQFTEIMEVTSRPEYGLFVGALQNLGFIALNAVMRHFGLHGV